MEETRDEREKVKNQMTIKCFWSYKNFLLLIAIEFVNIVDLLALLEFPYNFALCTTNLVWLLR